MCELEPWRTVVGISSHSLLIRKVIKAVRRLIEFGHTIPSLGCIGNRGYTVLGDHERTSLFPARESRT